MQKSLTICFSIKVKNKLLRNICHLSSNKNNSSSNMESLVTSSISFLLQKSELIWSESYTSDPDKSTFSIWWLVERKEKEQKISRTGKRWWSSHVAFIRTDLMFLLLPHYVPYICYQKTVSMMILSVQFPTIREKCLSK